MKPQALLKMVSYILAWRPDEFGLIPDESGFVKLKDLHQALSETEGFRGVRRRELEVALEVFGRETFEYLPEAGRVRARTRHYGAPAYTEDLPQRLWLPVKPRAWIRVSEEGWRNPQPALMSPERDLAERLARRRGALLVEVDPLRAAREGAIFLRFLEKLYLSAWLPPAALKGPRVDEKFRARYAPKSQEPEPEPEPIIPFRPDTEVPWRKLTRGKKKRLPWKEARKKKKEKDW
ncbi:hypothetical protein FVE67_06360 [Thermosulfurimonas marina]|uniref:RNA 2'-phosphotransferase n=1 Tax=Thermosulfurimonas marina TaxID=2047767 RepID=A0A6H1WTA6_9BACT|nr:hypothetical protein [Thermosulfurimonas marina]QJA06447.1 hypothetical protein FVE67_06360 [Thermosulfurimonas marina]